MAFASWTFVAYCLAATAALTAATDDIGVKSCAPGTWAVTFDDGPAQLTSSVLKSLADAGVNATFFVVGSQLEDPANVQHLKDAFNAGHQIASHSYTHANLTSLDEAAITKEMKDTDDKIAAAIGKVPNYMRPPFGECGAECQKVIEKLGYMPAIWNIDSRDWTHVPNGENADKILEDITRYNDGNGPVAKPTDPQGVISLQHDINSFSVDRLPKILEYIKTQGFKFATVADCAADGRPAAYKGDAAGAAAPSPAPESATASPSAAPSPAATGTDATGTYGMPSGTASPSATASPSESAWPSESASPMPASDPYGSLPKAASDPYGSSTNSSSSPTSSPTEADGSSSATSSPTATDGASPSPSATSGADSGAVGGADSNVGNVLTDALSAGAVSRPELLVSLVAPVTAILGFARML